MGSTETDIPAAILELFRKYGELEGGLSRTFQQVKALTEVFGMLGYHPGDEIDVDYVAYRLGVPNGKLVVLLGQELAPVKVLKQGSPIRDVFRIPDAPVHLESGTDATAEERSDPWRDLSQNKPKGRHQPPDDPTPRWS